MALRTSKKMRLPTNSEGRHGRDKQKKNACPTPQHFQTVGKIEHVNSQHLLLIVHPRGFNH